MKQAKQRKRKGKKAKQSSKSSLSQLESLIKNPSMRRESEPFVLTSTYQFLQSAAGSTAMNNYIAANNPTTNFLSASKAVIGSTVEGTRFQYGRVKAMKVHYQAINNEVFGGFLFSSSVVQSSTSVAPTNNNMTSYTSSPWGLQINNSPDYKSHPVGPLTGKSSMEWVVNWERPSVPNSTVLDTYSFATNGGNYSAWTPPTTIFWHAFGFESTGTLTIAGVTWKIRVDYLVEFFARNQMFN